MGGNSEKAPEVKRFGMDFSDYSDYSDYSDPIGRGAQAPLSANRGLRGGPGQRRVCGASRRQG